MTSLCAHADPLIGCRLRQLSYVKPPNLQDMTHSQPDIEVSAPVLGCRQLL